MKQLVTSGLAVACAMLCDTTQAQSALNFDVPGSYGTPYSGQGAYSDPGNNYWNTIPGSGGTSSGNLLSDGLTSTLITLSLSSYQTYNNGGDGGVDPAIGGLMAPFILENNGTPVTGTFNNVPNGTYDLYLYGGNYPDQDRGTSFTVNGVTQSTLGINYNQLNHTSALNSFVQGGSFNNATVVGGVGTLPANAAAANYVEFADLTVSGGSITFSFAANPFNRSGLDDFSGNNGEGDFNGVELVQVVPEPSTMAMTALGLCGFLAVMKRRRLFRP